MEDEIMEITVHEDAEIVESRSSATSFAGSSATSFADSLIADAVKNGYYATFDVKTTADKKRLYNARNNSETLSGSVGDVIEVADFVIDVITINDAQTKQPKQVPAVHIIDTDGKSWQSASTGVINSVCNIISSFGTPSEWDEPLQVCVKETRTTSNMPFKFLDVL